MRKTGGFTRRFQPALAVLLMAGLATTGYSGLALGQVQVSGPGLHGSLSISQNAQNGANADVNFVSLCKGQLVNISTTLLNFTVAGKTMADVEALTLPNVGPAGCKSANGGETLVVNTVVRPMFSNDGNTITAVSILLFSP